MGLSASGTVKAGSTSTTAATTGIGPPFADGRLFFRWYPVDGFAFVVQGGYQYFFQDAVLASTGSSFSQGLSAPYVEGGLAVEF
jgi:hypothetical protein